MRLNQKHQILEIVTTIEEGIDYASNSGGDKAIGMLKDCNEGLVFVSELMSGERKVLELLQKAIDEVHFLIVGTQDNKLFISYLNKIKTIMNDVRSTIIDEVETELEIAFMPYKISMWDSMESIYREAMNDSDCNCYVVPIPYYEKNEQGEIIKFCYEGNEFPEDIQTVPFEMYELENRKPDIIYIHNPFDNYNKLTMVQPRFFSENLAKYTDMLVYVPYYVAGGSQTTATNVAPAYNHATRIVAQSDVFKDALVRIGVPSEKILSLGSPKLDAMLASMNQAPDIPPYWRYAMSNRKVFLFNNGITNLLSVEEWYEQLEQTLNYFIENEDIALIWRPHPLTEITLKTMRPQYLERYSTLRKMLKQAENIILDTESDIYAAVSISDAIISDYSSVMLQCIVTGKPIYGLLNNSMIDPNQSYYANFSGCYLAGRDMSIPEFVEMVVRGEDPQKEERMSRFVSSIVNCDGTSGQKIHCSIKDEVLQSDQK